MVLLVHGCTIHAIQQRHQLGDLTGMMGLVLSGLSNAVESFGERQRSAEVLLVIETIRPGIADAPDTTERVFLILGDAIGKPKCQTLLRCLPWDREHQRARVINGEQELLVPLAVRCADRPSMLGATRGLDILTSDDLVRELLPLETRCTIRELEYDIAEEDARINIVTASKASRVLWQPGMKSAEPVKPRGRPTGLEGLPVFDPEQVAMQRRMRGHGRGRGRGNSRGQGGRGERGRGGHGARDRAQLALCDGEVNESAPEDDPEGDDSDGAGAEFVEFIVEEFDPSGEGSVADDVREVVAADVGAFAEMFVASLEGDVADNVDPLAVSGEDFAHGDALPAAKEDDAREAEQLMEQFGGELAGTSSDAGPAQPEVEVLGVSLVGGSSSSSGEAPMPLAAEAPMAVDAGPMPVEAGPGPGVAAEPEYLQGITFDDIEKGGFVKRDGVPIGRVTRWTNGRSLGVRCYMHSKCSHAVSSKVPMHECVRWIAQGIKPPAICSDAIRKDLANKHWAVRRPTAIAP